MHIFSAKLPQIIDFCGNTGENHTATVIIDNCLYLCSRMETMQRKYIDLIPVDVTDSELTGLVGIAAGQNLDGIPDDRLEYILSNLH